jgi:hypothetical protein
MCSSLVQLNFNVKNVAVIQCVSSPGPLPCRGGKRSTEAWNLKTTSQAMLPLMLATSNQQQPLRQRQHPADFMHLVLKMQQVTNPITRIDTTIPTSSRHHGHHCSHDVHPNKVQAPQWLQQGRFR